MIAILLFILSLGFLVGVVLPDLRGHWAALVAKVDRILGILEPPEDEDEDDEPAERREVEEQKSYPDPTAHPDHVRNRHPTHGNDKGLEELRRFLWMDDEKKNPES